MKKLVLAWWAASLLLASPCFAAGERMAGPLQRPGAPTPPRANPVQIDLESQPAPAALSQHQKQLLKLHMATVSTGIPCLK